MISCFADLALDLARVFMQAPGAAILVSKVSRFQGCAAAPLKPRDLETRFQHYLPQGTKAGNKKPLEMSLREAFGKLSRDFFSPISSVSSFLLPSISSWTIFPLEHRDSGPIDYRQPSTFCIESASDSRYCGSVITLSTRICPLDPRG